MSVNYSDWVTWATAYEPTAFAGYTAEQITEDCYDESLALCQGIEGYLNAVTYRLVVYRLAMHNLILISSASATPLNSLYTKYDVAQNTGLLSSASDSSSSASKMIAAGVQAGDAATMLLWSTPYGQYAESVFEQLKNVAFTV